MSGFANEAYSHLPEEIGAGYAERLRDLPALEFRQRLEQHLDGLRAMLLQSGYPAPAAALICQTAREVAEAARQQA
jgi:hypothetical protein